MNHICPDHVIEAPSRPALRYHGGKWKLAPWIIEHFPPHRVYVEPFGGAASVLLRKPRANGEVYNDLDGDVVTLFRILRDPALAGELCRRVTLTPFSRQDFKSAYETAVDDVDVAVKMLIRAFMGFGSASMTRTHMTGFRSNSSRDGTIPATDWSNWPSQIRCFTERLRGVVIEQRDAGQVILTHDAIDTLHYCDPPYSWSTRSSLTNRNGNIGHYYRHDMSDEQHRELAQVLHEVAGMVVLSGYPSELYDKELYPNWHRVERGHMADGARPRVEVVWMNDACRSALERAQSQARLIA